MLNLIASVDRFINSSNIYYIMKKLLNVLLILFSLILYLEWGTDNNAFLGQTEYELLFVKRSMLSFMHPFVLVPLTGQLLLFITLFQKSPGKVLSYIGFGALSVLILFVFLIGLFGGNFKIAFSALPFLITGVLMMRAYRKK